MIIKSWNLVGPEHYTLQPVKQNFVHFRANKNLSGKSTFITFFISRFLSLCKISEKKLKKRFQEKLFPDVRRYKRTGISL